MWFQFGNIEERTFDKANGDGTYTAFELTGIKKGYQNAPDEEWSRKIFKSQSVTVIENGQARPDISLVSFFQKAVKPGALIDVKQQRNGNYWDIISVRDISQGTDAPAEYTPADAANVAPEQSSGDSEASEEASKTPEYTPNTWE